MEAMCSIILIILPKGKRRGTKRQPEDLAHTMVIRHNVMFQNLHAVSVSSVADTKAQ